MVERRLISIFSQLQLLERLQHITYLSSSIIFVSGDSGSGKSTLIEQLSNKVPDNVQQVFIQLNEQLSDPQIRLQIITQLYEQPLFDAQDHLFSSMSLLLEKQPSDVPRLIILDNAHYLSQDLLQELLQVTMQKEQFAESEINVLLLAEEQDNQKMLAFINQINAAKRDAFLEFKLAALDQNEANALLNHIFEQEGYTPQIQHQDALQKQLLSCAGNPGKIIRLAEQIAAGEQQHKEPSWLKTRLPAVLLMLVLLMTVAAIGYYLYPKFIKPLPVETAEPLEDEDVLLEEIPATQLTSNELKPEAAEAELVEELAGNWVNKTDSDVQDNQLSVGIDDKDALRVVISDNEILNLAGVNTDKEASAGITKAQPLAERQPAVEETVSDVQPLADATGIALATDVQPLADIADTQIIKEHQPVAGVKDIQVVDDVQPVEDIQSLKEMIDNQPSQTELQNKNVKEGDETTIVTAIPEMAEVQDAEVIQNRRYRTKIKQAAANHLQAKDVVIESEITALDSMPKVAYLEKNNPPQKGELFTSHAQLLAIDPSHYTLQLSGMALEKTLQEFVADYNLPAANVYIYQTVRKNKPWYVVIFGEYKSRQLAKQASKKLPGALANMDTWIKKYQLVHQDLRLNNE